MLVFLGVNEKILAPLLKKNALLCSVSNSSWFGLELKVDQKSNEFAAVILTILEQFYKHH